MNYYLGVFQKYADFNGRARRSEFWFFFLFNLIAIFATLFIGILIKFPSLTIIYYLGMLIPYWALLVRRMHDNNRSGWFVFVPFYNLILLLSEGTRGPNEYGPDPKDPDSTFRFGESGLLDDTI